MIYMVGNLIGENSCAAKGKDYHSNESFEFYFK